MSSHFRKSIYPDPVSQSAIRDSFPDFSFGTYVDPPGQVWADFVHDTDEFVVVAEGDMEIVVDGESERCGPGDLVLIPAGARHTLRTSKAQGSMWHYGYGRFGADHG